MWIWLASLGILVLCFVFAWKVMASSYNIFSNDKTLSMFKSFTPSDMSYFQETLRAVKSKMKALEDQSAYYELQFTRIHEKLNQMEQIHSEGVRAGSKTSSADEEDWKDMFYEENEKKEKLENELDITQQELESVKEELDLLKKSAGGNSELKAEYDSRVQEIQSMQNAIAELQRNLDASEKRGKELEAQLGQETETRQQINQKESELASLKSDFDNRLQDIESLQNNILGLQKGLEAASEREKELQVQLQQEAEVRQALSQTGNKYNSLKSEYDTRLQDIESLQNHILELKKNLEGASQREKDLEIQLHEGDEVRQAFATKESDYNSLKSEHDNLIQNVQSLQNTIQELQNNLEASSQHQHELEARLQQEEEARQGIARLETIYNSLKEEHDNRLQEVQSLQDTVENLQRNLDGYSENQKELERRLQEEENTRNNKESEYNLLKGDYDTRVHDIQSLQNTIQELQNNLENSSQRQRDLENQLQQELQAREDMANKDSELISLRGENEGLRKQITEMAMKQDEVEKKLMQFDDLQNKLNSYEVEKSKMIANLETILKQTRPENE